MANEAAAAPLAAHETIFQQALREFRESLTDQQTRTFETTKFHDLQTFLTAVQAKQKSDRTLRNMGRLSRFLEAMEAYEKIMDVFVNVHNAIGFIWGPMKFLLEMARSHGEAFNGLLEAYKRIGESLPLLEQFQRLFGTHEHMKKILAELFRDIFKFHRRALHFFQRPQWKLVFQAMWKQFQSDFGDVIEDIRQKRYLVDTQASLVEYELAATQRCEITQHIHEAQANEQARRKQYLIEWLALSGPYHADHDRMRAIRNDLPESGRWLLRKARFRSWYDMDSVNVPSLWITGSPGAGKSVLASLVIDEASRRSSTFTLFFYFRQDDPEKNTFLGMARSMLHQLLVCDNSLATIMYEAAYSRWEQTLNTSNLAAELLGKCLGGVGSAYIIVDGLDECVEAEQKRITSFLLQLVKDSGANRKQSRCAFFSQHDQSTEKFLSTIPTITIDESDSRADVVEYCRQQAEGIRARFDLEEVEAADLANKVACRSEGVFLLATVTMQNLRLQTSRATLREELQFQQLPKDLNEAYDRIMCKLWTIAPTQYERDIKRLLTFLACASRPVKWREMLCAFSIEDWRNSTHTSRNKTYNVVDLNDHQLKVSAKELCGALVEMEDAPNGEVRFAHSTFKQYLFSSGNVVSVTAHASLAELCLSYLSLWPFNVIATDDHVQNSAAKGAYAFTEYALVGWLKHLELAIRNSHESNDMASFLFGLTETLQIFFDQHWHPPKKAIKLQKKYHGLLTVFEDYDLRTKIEQTLASMQRFETSFVVDTEPFETLDLFQTVARSRLVLEHLTYAPDLSPQLLKLYGPALFKCSRIGCKWFHEGFETLEERELHKKKHERAFNCTHDGCPYSKLGFVTEEELLRHEETYQPSGPTENDFLSEEDFDDQITDEDNQSMEGAIMGHTPSAESEDWSAAGDAGLASLADWDGFDRVVPDAVEPVEDVPVAEEPVITEEVVPAEPVTKTAKNRTRKAGPKTFSCNLCPRQFTRRYNLTSHLRSHTDERPYKCQNCGKAFSRSGDLKRHKILHNGRNRFKCEGRLRNGEPWGCRRTFARADALAQHFRTSGYRCITPLLEQEQQDVDGNRGGYTIIREEIAAQKASFDAMEDMPTGNSTLPGLESLGLLGERGRV